MTEAECTCDEMADGNDCPACALGLVDDDDTDAVPLVWGGSDKMGDIPPHQPVRGDSIMTISEDGELCTDIDIAHFDYTVSRADLAPPLMERSAVPFDSSGTFRFRWSDHLGDGGDVWARFAPPCSLSDMIIRSNDRTLHFECVEITDFGTIATSDGDIVYEGDFVAPGRPDVTAGDERLVGL